MTAAGVVIAGLAAGMGLGMAYLRLLRANVDAFVAGAALRAVGLAGLRLGLAAGFLWAAAQWGAAALLAVLGGFLAARAVRLRRERLAP